MIVVTSLGHAARLAALPNKGGTAVTKVRTGICWPDYDLPVEPGTIRAFVEAAEELGFDHLTITDHVLISGYTNRLSDDYRPIPDSVATPGAVALKREDAF